MSSTKVYVSQIPNCDFCANSGVTRKAKYDGKTTQSAGGGRWANMCAIHFQNNGVGLGTGLGQEYVLGEEPERTDEDIQADVNAAIEAGDFDALEEALGDRDFAEFM